VALRQGMSTNIGTIYHSNESQHILLELRLLMTKNWKTSCHALSTANKMYDYTRTLLREPGGVGRLVRSCSCCRDRLPMHSTQTAT